MYCSVGVEANPVTLYRVGNLGDANPTEGIATILNLTAIGVGANGGTTYSENVVISGIASLNVLPSSSPTIVSFTQTGADLFVENSAWNCTLNANETTSDCVAIIRDAIGSTTTSTFTTSFKGTVVPYYTYTGGIPRQTSSALVHWESSLWWGSYIMIAFALSWVQVC
ncbi:hypothetical protein BDZ97DRAFT_1284803 [Flammula alnicola]|nr:hypothetical protein BDZ97DRAFT_1284803 [Flammula alnicola]